MTDPALSGLARNPALPADLLERLLESAGDDVLDALAHRSDLTTKQALTVFERRGASVLWPLLGNDLLSPADVHSDDPWAGLALLAHPGADPAWIPRIARSGDAVARSELATRFPLPPDIAQLLAEDDDLDVVTSVARCQPSLPPDLVDALAHHPHAAVRVALAGNEDLSPEVLRSHFDDERPKRCYACSGEPDRQIHRSCDGGHDGAILDLRLALAKNPATPPDALAAVDHKDLHSGWALAERTDLPRNAYASLARHPGPGVRWTLASNPAAIDLVPRLLADDPSREMKRAVALNPDVPLDLLAELAAQTRLGTIVPPRVLTATEAELRALAGSPVAQVRRLAAARPGLPADLAGRFVDDPDAGVAKTVAAHAVVTPDQLRVLASQYGRPLLARIALNPRCPADLANAIALDPDAPPKARRLVAGNPRLTPESLVAMLADADAEVVEAAAANLSLSVSEMARLLPGPSAERQDEAGEDDDE